eukprot:scaffold604_cov20-Tisochrysis_lutea.AAC.3
MRGELMRIRWVSGSTLLQGTSVMMSVFICNSTSGRGRPLPSLATCPRNSTFTTLFQRRSPALSAMQQRIPSTYQERAAQPARSSTLKQQLSETPLDLKLATAAAVRRVQEVVSRTRELWDELGSLIRSSGHDERRVRMPPKRFVASKVSAGRKAGCWPLYWEFFQRGTVFLASAAHVIHAKGDQHDQLHASKPFMPGQQAWTHKQARSHKLPGCTIKHGYVSSCIPQTGMANNLGHTSSQVTQTGMVMQSGMATRDAPFLLLREENRDWVSDGIDLDEQTANELRASVHRFKGMIPPVPDGLFQGRGIVTIAGGFHYMKLQRIDSSVLPFDENDTHTRQHKTRQNLKTVNAFAGKCMDWRAPPAQSWQRLNSGDVVSCVGAPHTPA